MHNLPLLDLHGVYHDDVPSKISKFIHANINSCSIHNFCPIMIMCGNSVEMVDIVIREIKKIPCQVIKEDTWTNPDGSSKFQYGVITLKKCKPNPIDSWWK
jgi:hypothetical protein